MENIVNINQTFEKLVLISKKINYKEFEDCTFKNCDFSNTDFSNSSFMDCEFIDCNLSMILVSNTSLKSVHFRNCKLPEVCMKVKIEHTYSEGTHMTEEERNKRYRILDKNKTK
jgi:uncharacterized protein YjbI with pentapeptide repeats